MSLPLGREAVADEALGEQIPGLLSLAATCVRLPPGLAPPAQRPAARGPQGREQWGLRAARLPWCLAASAQLSDTAPGARYALPDGASNRDTPRRGEGRAEGDRLEEERGPLRACCDWPPEPWQVGMLCPQGTALRSPGLMAACSEFAGQKDTGPLWGRPYGQGGHLSLSSGVGGYQAAPGQARRLSCVGPLGVQQSPLAPRHQQNEDPHSAFLTPPPRDPGGA